MCSAGHSCQRATAKSTNCSNARFSSVRVNAHLPLVNRHAVEVFAHVAKQVFEAMLADIGIGLEVQENIAVGRFREARESKTCLHRQQFKSADTCASGFYDDPRLFTD